MAPTGRRGSISVGLNNPLAGMGTKSPMARPGGNPLLSMQQRPGGNPLLAGKAGKSGSPNPLAGGGKVATAAPAPSRLSSVSVVGARPVTSEDFEQILEAGKGASDNEERITLITKCSEGRLFCSAQILRILETTPSVKTRLALVDLLAAHCTDPGNSGDLVGLFRFSEEKARVTEALKKRENLMKAGARGSAVTSRPGGDGGRGGRGPGGGAGGRGGRGGRGHRPGLLVNKTPTPVAASISDVLNDAKKQEKEEEERKQREQAEAAKRAKEEAEARAKAARAQREAEERERRRKAEAERKRTNASGHSMALRSNNPFAGASVLKRAAAPHASAQTKGSGAVRSSSFNANPLLGKHAPRPRPAPSAVLAAASATSPARADGAAAAEVASKQATRQQHDFQFLARYKFLKKVSLMASLTDDVIARIAGVLELEDFQPGDSICRQGEEGQKFYIIEEGHVKVERTDPETQQTRKLAVLDVGNYFGEMALLLNEPRSAHCVAVDDVRCQILKREDFEMCARGMLQEVLDDTMSKRRQSMAAASTTKHQDQAEEDVYDKDFSPVRTYEELLDINATKDFGKYDPTRLEEYMSDREFQLRFEMTREAFRSMQKWKRDKMKKALQLY